MLPPCYIGRRCDVAASCRERDLIREFPHLHHYPFKKSRTNVRSSVGDGSTDPRHIEF
jgi:hypothetical protein